MTLATLDIVSLAAGGDGVARHEGLVVFTPRTAPGDRVAVEVTTTGRVGRGVLRSIEKPGATRVETRCEHYEAPDKCGGCQWQHVDIAAQREQKRLMVRDAFQRIAKVEVPLPPIIGGDAWRYRRSLTLAMRKREDGSWYGGLRAHDDPEKVFEMNDCHITEQSVLDAWSEVFAASEHLPEESRLRGTVRIIGSNAHFTLEGGRAWHNFAEFLDAAPSLAAIWWHGEGKRRQLIADRRPAGAPGASFAQVNPAIADRMQLDVLTRVMAYAPKKVVDGYSGAGDTAVALAEGGVNVVALESDEEATAFAAARLGAPSRAIAARVEDVLDKHLPADVVILNPPRAGVDAKVTAALTTSNARAIVYVSCDPATLARDVARLKGWKVRDLVCYDMFPQTSHVETVCELVPESA
jgi:23S rRNA (uracil1939-C5)-methyltransferase